MRPAGQGDGGGYGGRVYAVELTTQNPLRVPYSSGYWKQTGDEAREDELKLEQRARALHHDCIITHEVVPGLIGEMIVLDPTAIRALSIMGPVAPIARAALACGIFYSAEDLPGPGSAEQHPILFSSPESAEEAAKGSRVAEVGLCERIAIYCERPVWPLLDPSYLAEEQIDCIIDPQTGDCAMIDKSRVMPLSNRSTKRAYTASRKHAAKQRRVATKC